MKRGRRESVGEAIEQLQKMKRKADTEHKRYKEMYITETVKESQNTVRRLSSKLETLQGKETNEETILKVVDELFSILFESHKNLDKIEDNYTFYKDLDDKFNQ